MKRGRCTQCGAELRDGPDFCPRCGARAARVEPVIVSQLGADESDLAELMRNHGRVTTCPACGALTATASQRCRSCGQPLGAGPEALGGNPPDPIAEEDITPYSPTGSTAPPPQAQQKAESASRHRPYAFVAAGSFLVALGAGAGYWLRPVVDGSASPASVEQPAPANTAMASAAAVSAPPVTREPSLPAPRPESSSLAPHEAAEAQTPVPTASRAPIPAASGVDEAAPAPVEAAPIVPAGAGAAKGGEAQEPPAAASVEGPAAPAEAPRARSASRPMPRPVLPTAAEKSRPREITEYSDADSMRRVVVDQDGQLTRTECSRGMFGWVCREIRGPES